MNDKNLDSQKNKLKEIKRAPELRFKGFSDDWEQRKLGNIKDVRDGTHDSPKYKDEGYPLVTSKNLTDTGLDLTNISLISQNDFDTINQRSKVDIGDILFGMIGTIGKPVLVDENEFAIKNVALLKKGGTIKNEFLIQLLKSPVFNRYLCKENVGGTQKFIGLNQIRNFQFFIPSIEEQIKIGIMFQKLDHTITLHQRKLDKLKQLKQGYLQKLFPKPGETVPKIRFVNFEDVWEQYKLGKLGNTFTGLSGKTKEDFGHGDAKFVTYVNVFRNPISNPSGTERVEIDEKQNQVKYGDIFFTTSSETPEEVGLSSVWLENTENVYLNSFCFGYRLTVEFDPYYLAFMLRSPAIRKKIMFLAQGISRYNISKKKVMEIEVIVPDTDEQRKVGSFFSQLDHIITLHQSKLDKLKSIKQSLLQKMFI